MRRRIEEDLNRTIRLSREIEREASDLLKVVRESNDATFDEQAVLRRTAELSIRLDARDSDVGIWSSVIRRLLPWWRRIWLRPRPVQKYRRDLDD